MTESFIVIMFVLVLYFLPSLIASGHKHHNASAIFVLNLLLGWSLIGWIVALVWAFVKPSPHATSPVR